MAQTMQFDLVSPERMLLSAEASAVSIPGAEGDLTAMPDHAPMITTLRPGILSVETGTGTEQFVVTGGFAEIGNGLSVLAERAMPAGDVDQATYEGLVDDAQAAYDAVKASGGQDAGAVDDAAKLLADTVAIASAFGLSPKAAQL